MEDLSQTKGIGRDKAIALKSAFTLAARMAQELQGEAPLLDTPERVADFLRDENMAYNVEHFQAVLLNSRRKLIKVEQISDGLVDSLLVHPREVFRGAIAANASSLVLVHNHPSGDPTPSESDVRVTRDLIRAGQLLKIEVADHIILGHCTAANSKGYFSMREMGLFFATAPAETRNLAQTGRDLFRGSIRAPACGGRRPRRPQLWDLSFVLVRR